MWYSNKTAKERTIFRYELLIKKALREGGFKKGEIQGLKVIPLEKYTDERGALLEIYRSDWKIHHKPQMAYISYTLPGKKRGPHLHEKQSDYFVFAGPGDLVFKAWDLREKSPTFPNFVEIRCGESYPVAIIVPPGVAHGYSNPFQKPGWTVNLPDKLYRGKNKSREADEVRFENTPLEKFLKMP